MTDRRVLITGASGMVGRYLVQAATTHGFQVVASGRRSAPLSDLWQAQDVQWVIHDLADWKTPRQLTELFGSVAGILHAGAAVPETPDALSAKTLYDAGPRAVLNLAEWARETGAHMVHLSGALVYRDQDRSALVEEDPVGLPKGPWRPYAASKIMAEQAVLSLADDTWNPTVLRPTAVYGWGLAPNKLIPSWLEKCRLGGTISLKPPVDDSIDLVHASDVAAVAVEALRDRIGGIFNVGGPGQTTMRELADACVRVSNAGAVQADGDAPGRKSSHRFSIDQTKALTSFEHRQRLSTDDGLTDMVRHGRGVAEAATA